MSLRVLDVFSGIGGVALGLHRAGMVTVGFCEIEPFCRAALAKNFPGVWTHDDIQTLTAQLIRERCGPIDMLAGGFPCPDISCAGKGAGLGTAKNPTARSGLYWQIVRILREMRDAGIPVPRLLLENVPALRTRGADEVLASLEGLGYACWPLVVGAWACGAPHKRDRVWIVAHAQGARRPSDPHDLRPGGSVETAADQSGDGAGGAHPSRGGLGTDRGALGGAGHADECGAVVAAWVECPEGCGEFWCNIHSEHACDCPCPPIDEWDRDPYVAHPGRTGREEQRAAALADESGQRARSTHATRWPARPGEPQHGWEEPRLARNHQPRADTHAEADKRDQGWGAVCESGSGGGAGQGLPQPPVGAATDGLPARLAGRRESRWRRASLKAVGNAVVPDVAEQIGRLILAPEPARVVTQIGGAP